MVNPVSPYTQQPTVPHWPISQGQLAPVSSDYPMPVTPGKAFEVRAFNNGSVPVWLKLYNLASTPNPASDPVFDKYEIVSGIGGAGFINSIELGQEFSAGIAFAVTANFGDTDNTAIGAGVVSVTILYK